MLKKMLYKDLSGGFVALFSGRAIQFAGTSLIGLFLPIYLFIVYGHDIKKVIYFYLIGHIIYTLLLPWGAQFLNKIGLRRSLLISIPIFAFYYIAIYFIERDALLYSFLAIVAITVGRILFWLPYNTDMAKFTAPNVRGKGVGLMWASNTFLSVTMPLVSGFIIADFGYNIVFILAVVIYLSSIIPFLALPHTREKYSWGYVETFKHFFSKRNRGLVLANMANGAENTVGIIIWPIFIWDLLDGNYIAVGTLSSLIVVVTIILQLGVGKYTDVFNKRKMIHWGSLFYAFGWIGKIFVLTSFQIFIAGTYHKFVQIFKDTPFDALNYEIMADHGHYVDEYTVIREMAVQMGKFFMLLFILLIALNFGLNWTFALAALASLFINLL